METDPSKSELHLQPPKSLKFCSGGFFGSSLRLEWDGSNLYRQRQDSGGSDPHHCSWVCLRTPSVQAWFELRQVLDELNAWNWPRKSDNPDVMDGWQWDLGLVWGTRKWSGCGSNAFPLGFKKVERVLERLAKGRKASGIPSGFEIRACGKQGEVRFVWDGRILQWWCWATGTGCSSQGERSGLSSVAWKGFNRAFSKARRMGLPQGGTLDGYPGDRGYLSNSCFDLDMSDQPSALWHKVVLELVGLSGLELPFGSAGVV